MHSPTLPFCSASIMPSHFVRLCLHWGASQPYPCPRTLNARVWLYLFAEGSQSDGDSRWALPRGRGVDTNWSGQLPCATVYRDQCQEHQKEWEHGRIPCLGCWSIAASTSEHVQCSSGTFIQRFHGIISWWLLRPWDGGLRVGVLREHGEGHTFRCCHLARFGAQSLARANGRLGYSWSLLRGSVVRPVDLWAHAWERSPQDANTIGIPPIRDCLGAWRRMWLGMKGEEGDDWNLQNGRAISRRII